MTTRAWRIGIDVGGTFTDIVACRPADGLMRSAKIRSLKHDPLSSIVGALRAVGLSWEDVEALVHGTTVATNAIVEDRLAPVALIGTEGFADVLQIGRQNRRFLYRLDLPPKAAPLVSRELSFGLAERIGHDGTVHQALVKESVAALCESIAKTGVRTVAVSLMHAYANPSHELALRSPLREVVDHVSLSHMVNPEEREFERAGATVLNAGLMPLVSSYLDTIESALPREVAFSLFHSAGGMVAASTARERPLVLALSGPSAGVTAACRVSADLGIPMVLTLDMGGTTTDVSLIRNARPEVGRDATLAGHQLRQPMIAVESIGAGGGSIAAAEGGSLRVGPTSAGADPGPACFGLGGELPTVTDANLVLGYLDPALRLGGEVTLSPDLAAAAVERLGRTLGLDLVETALGIVRIANASMVRALRNITTARGIDGRRCCLMAFGGAGPMHAAQLAKDFGIAKVIVPHFSSAFSALGCVVANPSFTRQQTLRMSSGAWDGERFASTRAVLLADVLESLAASNSLRLEPLVEEQVLVKYVGQSYSVEVPYSSPADPEAIAAEFYDRHRALYGFATDESWEVEAIRIRATVSLAAASAIGHDSGTKRSAAPATVARCWFDKQGPVDVPRYRRGDLPPATMLHGPAIVFDEWSTIVVPPTDVLSVDERGHLTIGIGGLR